MYKSSCERSLMFSGAGSRPLSESRRRRAFASTLEASFNGLHATERKRERCSGLVGEGMRDAESEGIEAKHDADDEEVDEVKVIVDDESKRNVVSSMEKM